MSAFDEAPTDQLAFCKALGDVFNTLSDGGLFKDLSGDTQVAYDQLAELSDICAAMEPPATESSVDAWPIGLQVVVVLFLIAFSGIFSGLNLGLLGLDLAGLGIVEKGGNEHLKKCARKIMRVRKHGNWLLCSLLLGNVAVNAALAIFLDNLFTGLVGFISSTALIVVFGEIVPQALCTRYALQIGAKTVWLVWIVMILISPIAWPISKILDFFLGDEVGQIYNNEELKELISLHINTDDAELDQDIGKMMRGALNLPKAAVQSIMTPWEDVFKLNYDEKLNFETLTTIFKSGHSRIPCVDETDQVVGLLFTKDLVLLPPQDETPVMTVVEVYDRPVPKIFSDARLTAVLNDFAKGNGHLAVVREVNSEGPGDPYYYNVGIVTLEDIMEFIVGMDIVDETDVFVNMRDKSLGKRSIDVTKLSLFDYRRRLPPNVTPQEAQAVFLHLSGSIPVFKPESQNIDPKELKKLISVSELVEVIIEKKVDGEESKSAYDAADEYREKDISQGGIIVYENGVPSDYFTLILDGKVEIEAGMDKFKSQVSRWTPLCEGSITSILENPNSQFIPDFTARVVENARILRISRRRFFRSSFRGSEGDDGSPPVFEDSSEFGVEMVRVRDDGSRQYDSEHSEQGGRGGISVAIVPGIQEDASDVVGEIDI